MSAMTLAVGFAIWNAGNPKFAPKPPSIGTYIIHAGNVKCFETLMGAASGRSDLKSLQIGSFLKLKEVALKCGGRVELVKN